MRLNIITLFPEFFSGPTTSGLLGKAVEKGLLDFNYVDLREFGEGKHRTTDDTPYGGGAGMVMKVAPLVRAIEETREKNPGTRVVMMTPQGEPFGQVRAREYSNLSSLTLICGRYEGFDERIRSFVDEEVSIGDFVLMGGETGALAVVEALSRFIPGVLGDIESTSEESLSEGLLEYPHYTRPREFRGMEVPEVLLGGNHAEIARWRREQSLKRTFLKRPDLLERADLTEAESALVKKSLKQGGEK